LSRRRAAVPARGGWRVTHAASALLAVAALPACSDELPPLGEVVVYVDTDLPVPAMASRLRVDVFDHAGAWRTSRDHALGSPSDWPVSFSVVSTDESAPTEAMVRLRAYRDVRTRDYRGERFVAPEIYQDPWTAQTLDDLCAAPPVLVLGRALTLRRGYTVITSSKFDGSCPQASRSGAVAAQVTIPEAGRYRFEVTSDTSYWSTLFLRAACAEEDSEVICAEPTLVTLSNGTQIYAGARVVVDLQPGAYTLLSSTIVQRTAADVTLRGAREDLWAVTPPADPAPDDPFTPRLVEDSVDITPADEPEPWTAIDRLVRLHLEPGQVVAARVVLRGACLGSMAQLAPAMPVTAVDLATATTCIDVEGERVVPPPEPGLDVNALEGQSSEVDGFGHGLPCPSDAAGRAVCVPGGVFALGGNFGSVYTPGTLPERAAVVSTFWMDRNEVTVGDLRAAVDAGLEFPRLPPLDAAESSPQQCTWTKDPGPNEEYPVVCIDYDAARAFCQQRGGDLPTEAQWEYAASKAWRASETRWPWGDTPPTCTSAAYGRWPAGTAGECQDQGLGAVPVDLFASTDRTPGPGLLNMAGSAEEWTLDSAYDYDKGCWSSASLVDPLCTEKEPARHALRGGAWGESVGFTVTTKRWAFAPTTRAHLMGFRCSYPVAPAP
jgi:formylglycine-generating enzyme required for sulfatase activity